METPKTYSETLDNVIRAAFAAGYYAHMNGGDPLTEVEKLIAYSRTKGGE